MTNPLSIRPETFAPLGLNKYGDEIGTIMVGTVETRAIRGTNGITVAGFVGRYRTSNKAWWAHVTVRADGETWARFGRDDRSGRFNKLQGVSFEPGLFPLENAPAWNVV